MLPNMATGFGAGVGRKGSLCGALTGSVMVIGMIRGRADANDQDRKEDAYSKCAQFWEAFEKEFGSNECYGLSQCRFDDPADRERWLRSGGMAKCARIVERAVELLSGVLQEP
jgi:C_GCAxxG_C_C family probable redox protein